MQSSFFPLVLSVVVAVLAIVFANPIFPAIAAHASFVPGIVSDWKIWVPLIVLSSESRAMGWSHRTGLDRGDTRMCMNRLRRSVGPWVRAG